MVGIYKITNKINNKSYIGQSIDILKRFNSHKYKSDTLIGRDIQKYGEENFELEILEECDVSELDEKEIYYINKYDTIRNGYNISLGKISSGEYNPNCKLTEKEVYEIRLAYKEHKDTKEVYEKYKDIISYNYFLNIWEGRSWKNIMPEVYTEGNKIYYSKQKCIGEKSSNAIFTDEEVINLRERYVNETAAQIYESVKDRCSYQTLQQILWGRYYSYLKYYDKRIKKWIQKII